MVLILLALATVAGAAPKKHAPGALVLVLDRSGSMQGPKLDTVRDGALAAIEALDPADQVAVITFDSEARLAIPLQPAANKKAIAKELAKLDAGGGTAFLPALQSAEKVLHDSKLASKLVILFTDGESPSEGIPELVKTMHQAKVTVSAVGVQGADKTLLSLITDAGGGRLYMVEDLGSIPKIFVREIESSFR
jgi:Ca-activated chloride channel family protein